MITLLLVVALLPLAAPGVVPSAAEGTALFSVVRALSFATLVPVFLSLLDRYVSGRHPDFR